MIFNLFALKDRKLASLLAENQELKKELRFWRADKNKRRKNNRLAQERFKARQKAAEVRKQLLKLKSSR